METLNDHCLIHIFEYLLPHEKLDAMEVCSQWRNLMPYAWQKSRKLRVSHEGESLYRPEKDISPETLIQILNCSSQYFKIIILGFRFKYIHKPIVAELNGCRYTVIGASIPEIVTILSDKCRNVLKLEIHEWKILTDHQKLVQHLIKSNEQLENLDCQFQIGKKIGFHNVPRSLVHLVTSNENLSHKDFVLFCRETTGLKALSLLGFNFFTSLEFLNHLKNVQSLEWYVNFRLNVASVIKNLSFLTNLQKLVLINLSDDSTNAVLKEVGSTCKNIKSLTLGKFSNITDGTVNSIIASLTNLEELWLHALPLQSLIPSASVTKLFISSCSHFGIDSLNEIVRNMPSLRHLYFYNNGGSDNRLIDAVYVAINTALLRNLTFLTSEQDMSEEGRYYYSFVAVREGTQLTASGQKLKNDSLLIAHFLPQVVNLTQLIKTYVEEQLEMCHVSHFLVWEGDLGTVLDREACQYFKYI